MILRPERAIILPENAVVAKRGNEGYVIMGMKYFLLNSESLDF